MLITYKNAKKGQQKKSRNLHNIYTKTGLIFFMSKKFFYPTIVRYVSYNHKMVWSDYGTLKSYVSNKLAKVKELTKWHSQYQSFIRLYDSSDVIHKDR